jgi:hypothetical protein
MVFTFAMGLAGGPSLVAQRANATLLGGTLGTAPKLTQYKCKAPKGTLDVSADSNLVFNREKQAVVDLPYASISSLKYGLETVTGAFCYPWESYVQFTKKRHYLLTVVFTDGRQEQAVVFEVEKPAVRSVLGRLEARSGKEVEFTDPVACLEYKTPDGCGHGQPGELSGLTRVYIETSAQAALERISAEITGAQLGLTLVSNVSEAEIVLKYHSRLVAETGYGSLGANGGMPMDAGRGEVHVVRDGRSRVVVMFEDIKMSPLQKHPATNFGRAFVESYRKAIRSANATRP